MRVEVRVASRQISTTVRHAYRMRAPADRSPSSQQAGASPMHFTALTTLNGKPGYKKTRDGPKRQGPMPQACQCAPVI
jgi:hypothetical protein